LAADPAGPATFLHGLSTALPPNRLTQDQVQTCATQAFGGRYPQFDRLSASFATAGIDKRHSVVPMEWFLTDHNWQDRNAAYVAGAKALFVEAATAALTDAGWTAQAVDCVVTVSSTGIVTPTLDAQVFGTMGFREDIMRVPVFGLGCAGGVSGLSVAQSIAVARPGARVLLVVIEACTLSFRADRMKKADIIAAVLFGDGAAAACLCTDRPGGARRIRLGHGYQKLWPDSLDIMGWDVDKTGFGVIFDRSIPSFVQTEFAQATASALEAANLNHAGIERYVCHPGGAKVLDAIEGALHLEQGSLVAERETLRQAGNMSAPTVLFVLKSVLETGTQGQMMACALGPGFTASYMPVHVGPKAA